MAIYLAIFSAISIYALLENPKHHNPKPFCNIENTREKSWNFPLFTLACIITILAGARWKIGTDWQAFLDDFEFMQTASWSEVNSSIYGLTYGKGYVLLTYLFAKYIGNYSVYLTVQAVIIIICVYPVIFKYSRYPAVAFLGLFAYSFGYAFAVPRSGIAIALCFRAFDTLLKKKYIHTFIYIFLAVLFHNTAIIFALVFLFKRLRLKINKVVVFGIIAVALSFFARPLLLGIASLPFMPASISIRIQVYFASSTEYGGVGEIVRIITRGFVVVLIFLNLWNKRENQKINLLVNMYLISALVYIATSGISEVFMRLAYYFEDVSQYIIFSECIAVQKNKGSKCLLTIVLIAFFAAKMLSRLVGNDLLVPYRTIF